MATRILLTSALPYANGPIHLGYLLEAVMTDVHARFQRMRGRECAYVCADDAHGTAVMARARQEGVTEEALLERMNQEHQRDLAGFQVRFDHYGSTHSDDNRALAEEFWSKLRASGLVHAVEVTQLYDPVAETFLADRFVKGGCPSCGAPEQYGDNCERCGATYSASELVEPRSTLSGAAPELRTAPHLVVRIEPRRAFLEDFTQAEGRLQPENQRFLRRFLEEPLHDWDVTRPARYFGFEVPDFPGNYWYVWFDAPIGYLAATREWCRATGRRFDDWWRDPATRVVHVIGKDIMRFHALFWPVMLDAAGYVLPSRIQVHGFLTVNGQKMSKSRGTFVLARTWLDAGLDPSYLRYFLASKLGGDVSDLDLDLDELQAKVNADLIGKVVNLASRTARFVPSLAERYPDDGGLFAEGAAARAEIEEAYEVFDTARALRRVMALADRANEYVDREQPWSLKKQAGAGERLRDVCTVALNLYRQIVLYLAPVLPDLADKSGALLGEPLERLGQVESPLLGARLGTFTPLMQRVDPARLRCILGPEAGAEPGPAAGGPGEGASSAASDDAELAPLAAPCTVEDFARVDLRVAEVLEAHEVPGADKLLRLVVSLGGEERRTIFAGIKASYAPERLVGRLIVVVANLPPRKFKFGVSEGMVVAAGAAGGGARRVFVLSPDEGARPGMRLS